MEWDDTMKCDNCNKPATVHLTEIKNGKKIEKHLCEQCAAAERRAAGQEPHADQRAADELRAWPTRGCQKEAGAGVRALRHHLGGVPPERAARVRSTITQLFEKDLTPLLQRAHEGATHHVGKVPTRRGGTGVPAEATGRRRPSSARNCQQAVEAEDYERAAKLRDQIKQAEG